MAEVGKWAVHGKAGLMALTLLLLTLLLLPGFAAVAHAQNGNNVSNNILGLPAVPQLPALSQPSQPSQPSQSPASRALPAKPGIASLPANDAEAKSVLSGNINLASFYQDGTITVRVTTDKTFLASEPRAQAVQAAKLVQRDVRLACGKLCKPAAMPEPRIQADNTLSFELRMTGYQGMLSTTDMANLLNARAIGPGGKALPVAISAPIAATVRSTPALPGLAPAPASMIPASTAASAAAGAAGGAAGSAAAGAGASSAVTP